MAFFELDAMVEFRRGAYDAEAGSDSGGSQIGARRQRGHNGLRANERYGSSRASGRIVARLRGLWRRPGAAQSAYW